MIFLQIQKSEQLSVNSHSTVRFRELLARPCSFSARQRYVPSACGLISVSSSMDSSPAFMVPTSCPSFSQVIVGTGLPWVLQWRATEESSITTRELFTSGSLGASIRQYKESEVGAKEEMTWHEKKQKFNKTHRLTFDSQVHGGVHCPIAIVPYTGVYTFLLCSQGLQIKRSIWGSFWHQLVIFKEPWNPWHRVAVHITVKYHRALRHDLLRDIYPNFARGI